MEFVYSKVGINAFEKVTGLNRKDKLVNLAYKEYVFNKDTDEAFLLRLNLGQKAMAFIELGNFQFFNIFLAIIRMPESNFSYI
jgi:hypothetical protein